MRMCELAAVLDALEFPPLPAASPPRPAPVLEVAGPGAPTATELAGLGTPTAGGAGGPAWLVHSRRARGCDALNVADDARDAARWCVSSGLAAGLLSLRTPGVGLDFYDAQTHGTRLCFWDAQAQGVRRSATRAPPQQARE